MPVQPSSAGRVTRSSSKGLDKTAHGSSCDHQPFLSIGLHTLPHTPQPTKKCRCDSVVYWACAVQKKREVFDSMFFVAF